MIFDKLKTHIWQALAATLFVALCATGFKLIGALHDRDTARTALANEQRDRDDEVRTLMRAIQNDRALLPPSGVGLKPPPRTDSGPTP